MGQKVKHVADLVHDTSNPRKHNERNLKAIVDSLHSVGFARSIVIDEDNQILAGNGVTEAAVLAGIENVVEVEADGNTIVAVRRRGLSDEQKQLLKYHDNRSSELAEWNPEQLLADMTAGIPLEDFWRQDELDELLAEIIKPTSSADRTADDYRQIERMAELREKWQTEIGQVWQVKGHRLMCGDSSNAEHVDLLLSGEQCNGILTDPPYELNPDIVTNALAFYAERAVVLCGGKLSFNLVRNGWEFCIDLVWKHRQPRSFATQYQPVMYHNNVVMLRRGKEKLGWQRPDSGFGSIIEMPPGIVEYVDTEYGHGKCIELFEELLRGFAWKRCADPFLGTGATMLACERRGVACYGMELEPGVIAVALERAANAGLEPRLT